jgi:hypothetical protein
VLGPKVPKNVLIDERLGLLALDNSFYEKKIIGLFTQPMLIIVSQLIKYAKPTAIVTTVEILHRFIPFPKTSSFIFGFHLSKLP